MSVLPRAGVVVSCLILAVVAAAVVAYQPPPGPEPPPTPPAPEPMPPDPTPPAADPVLLPVNRSFTNKVRAAEDYIASNKAKAVKDQDWDKAVSLLHRILIEDEDGLLEEKNAAGKVVRRYSARAEAERMLADLAKGNDTLAGLKTYRDKFDATAQTILARGKNDPRLLEDIVRRYLHTPAGGKALALLGLYELDRGRVDASAAIFRRLLDRPNLEDVEPLALFHAALAFHGAGASDAKYKAGEEEALKKLELRVGRTGLALGGNNVSVDDLRKEVARWPVGVAAAGDWPLFRGDPRRTGRGEGDFPLLEARVKVAYKDVPAARAALDPPAGQPPSIFGPHFTAFTPLAVGGRLIYRASDGLHALDADDGRQVWHAATPLCLESALSDFQKKYHVRKWLEMYKGFSALPDENGVIGALSSDGRRVFAVDDLPLPPHPNDLIPPQPGMPATRKFWGPAEANINHNRLRAHDVLTGDFLWEIGGWANAKDGSEKQRREFLDVFFLGPPLPVGGKLYALVERRQDINLLCLDPGNGDLLWSQTLCSTHESVSQDPARRMQPAHLAYADGVLVCPTNSGAVIAVDPLTRNLLWVHIYRERQGGPDTGPINFDPNQFETAWQGCAPVLQDGKVVFTAPDANLIRCLDLHTGAQVWTVADRPTSDLYLAGVFRDKVLIVSDNGCHALDLATGAPVPGKGGQPWGPSFGQPSGLGAAVGDVYFIPLKDGSVYALNVANPAASSVIENRSGAPLGNLVMSGGDLWSQSTTGVTAYPQLERGLERVQARLKKNDKDPAALIERGRLLYTKGESVRAVEDWLAALDLNPPADQVEPTRERLFVVLTQLLQRDFPTGEKYLAKYEELCQKPAPAGLTPEQLDAFQKEQRRRLLNLYAIRARGREGQGRVAQALQDYRKLYDTAGAGDLLPVPDDPTARMRSDLWVQGRVAALAKQAAPADRKALEEEITGDWKTAQSAGDEAALARFVGLYGLTAGPLGAPAREARLMLADRLIESRDRHRALEAELHLHYLSKQTDSPDLAARALYAWARLLTRHGLLGDAVAVYRTLARDYPTAVVHDGKTGAQLLEGLGDDKRFVAYLDDQTGVRPPGRPRVTETAGQFPPKGQFAACEPQIPLHGARNLIFSIDKQTQTLLVASKDGAVEPWSTKLPSLAGVLQYLPDPVSGNGNAVTYQASDHFAAINVGPLVIGVDLIERKERWARSLPPPNEPTSSGLSYAGDGKWQLVANDGRVHWLGLVGPVGPNGVFINTKSGLASLDLSTGDLRWLRADAPPMVEAMGDDQNLYVVEFQNTSEVRAVRGVRTADGVAFAVPNATPNCVENYMRKTRVVGARILLSDPDGAGRPTLRLYDVALGKDVWKRTFAKNAVVLESFVPELAAVAEPDGAIRVIDLVSLKEPFKFTVDKKDLEQLQRGALLRDRTQLYVALQLPQAPPVVGAGQNFSWARATAVNGRIYAFDRFGGEPRWQANAPNQWLLLDHFEEAPSLVCSAFVTEQLPSGIQVNATYTRAIDKLTGKVFYNKRVPNFNDQFHTVQVDGRAGTIELTSNTQKLRQTLETGREDPAPPKPPEGGEK
jgi:outer membrane protein assembly factor BamB/tetratricopeptide (TPR) repeat protein